MLVCWYKQVLSTVLLDLSCKLLYVSFVFLWPVDNAVSHSCQHTQCALLSATQLQSWAILWLQLPVSWLSTDNSVKLQLQLQSCIALMTGHRHATLTVITA